MERGSQTRHEFNRQSQEKGKKEEGQERRRERVVGLTGTEIFLSSHKCKKNAHWVSFDWAIMYSVNVVYFDLGSGRDYIYHGTTTFRGLHYKDELKLTDKQKAEYNHQGLQG